MEEDLTKPYIGIRSFRRTVPAAAATPQAPEVTSPPVSNVKGSSNIVSKTSNSSFVPSDPGLTAGRSYGVTTARPAAAVGAVSANPPAINYVKDKVGSNVLNNYRSVTYNFTLAALDIQHVNDSDGFDKKNWEKFIVLSSKGKGAEYGISPGNDISANVAAAKTARVTASPANVSSAQQSVDYYNITPSIISGFNKNSPGRFDMFLDNVIIESTMAYNNKTNASLVNRISFDVYEPYSINGFIEALHVAAIAAGHINYVGGCFVLKMEFQGYPDNVDLPNPVTIPNAERYFAFAFSTVEMTLTETGTKYRCTGVSYSERVTGKGITLAQPLTVAGLTVGEILTNMCSELTTRNKNDAKKINSQVDDITDEYEIKFQLFDGNSGFKDAAATALQAATNPIKSQIADAKLSSADGNQLGNAVIKMADPGELKEKIYGISNNPLLTTSGKKIPTMTIANDTNLIDTISNCIRDSSYLQDKLKNCSDNIDKNGFFDYFMVKTEVINLGLSKIQNRAVQKIIFVVHNTKIHYTKIPDLQNYVSDNLTLDATCLRAYNYIYTGQNIDILNFKLDFNNLFFEAIPARGGESDYVASKTQSAVSQNTQQDLVRDVQAPAPIDQQLKSVIALAPVRVNPSFTSVVPASGVGGTLEYNRYFAMARAMHETVVNAKSNMLTGELTIVGDPFYLVSRGIGSYNPAINSPGTTKTGECMPNYSQVHILLNFQNAYDINSLEKGGSMEFRGVDFNGVYQVLLTKNEFRDGKFVQKLEIVRVPGQQRDVPNAKWTGVNDLAINGRENNTASA